MILGEAFTAPDPVFLAGFLGCAYFLVALGEKAKNLFGRGESQKREVTMSPDFVSKTEFTRHSEDDRQERARLHERIDESIADYNEKFQQLPNSIVALLRNTGVIRDRFDK